MQRLISVIDSDRGHPHFFVGFAWLDFFAHRSITISGQVSGLRTRTLPSPPRHVGIISFCSDEGVHEEVARRAQPRADTVAKLRLDAPIPRLARSNAGKAPSSTCRSRSALHAINGHIFDVRRTGKHPCGKGGVNSTTNDSCLAIPASRVGRQTPTSCTTPSHLSEPREATSSVR